MVKTSGPSVPSGIYPFLGSYNHDRRFREEEMSHRLLRIFAGVALLLSVVFIPAPPVVADGTSSLYIVKYAADGVTILNELTLDYTQMESQLPVQGNGTTTYYHQGPTFDGNNLWDPDETHNLKTKGAPKGTDLKDLCDLVGGMSASDTVRVTAIDGFSKTFDYANVYNPDQRQGKIVVAWYSDRDGYVPTWEDGMLLVFFAQTTNAAGQYVFGNEDMRQTLPENRWHYFDIYPSSNGFSVKNIDRIAIYSTGSGEEPDRQRAEMSVSATVVMPEVGISLSRSAVDYGDVEPGQSSPVVGVGIANIGTRDVFVSLEVQGSDQVAQRFYERSLYIDGAAYTAKAVIATIGKAQSKNLDTQLRVPSDWDEFGRQDAVFVFWAEATD
jgi:hypothetical protein